MDFSNKYILGFAAAICVVCALAVSSLAVALGDVIDKNRLLDQQRQVLRVSGLAAAGEDLSAERVAELFQSVEGKVIDRRTGEYLDLSIEDVDPIKEAGDTELSIATPDEAKTGAQVPRLPDRLEVFEVTEPGKECIVLPIHGKGLWSTMYGYLALTSDASEVKGITFYQHGETPGLGGEIDNKQWQASWIGKSVYKDGGIGLGAVKKSAPRDEDYQVDGLSGATITTRGVDATVKLWLGDAGYGPYLERRKTDV